MMVLSDIAAEGTVYHEAFHVVQELLLTPEQNNRIMQEARQKWGNLSNAELKEKLAEDFREYTQTRIMDRKNGKAIANFFRDLLAQVKNLVRIILLFRYFLLQY